MFIAQVAAEPSNGETDGANEGDGYRWVVIAKRR